jgi:DNA modification methylase
MSDLRLGRWQDVLAEDPPDGSVRLILTSPPYDNARTYEGTNEPVDFGELAAWCIRKLMPGGTLAMVLDGPCEDGRQSITPYRVICEWSALEGWYFHQFLVYGRGGVPGNTKGWFRRDHEPLLVFVKEGGEQICNKEHMVERAVVASNRKEAGGVSQTKRGRDGRMISEPTRDPASWERRHRGSIWWYGVVGQACDASARTGHPATFAEAFARDAVDVWSNPGDLVVDPYAGSCTVGRACEDLGRRFIGAERVPKYHAIGMARLAQRGLFQGVGT